MRISGHGLLGETCARRAAAAVAKSLGASILRKQALASLSDDVLQAIFEV